MIALTDEEIAAFINEPKTLPGDFIARARLKVKRGHRESELRLDGYMGTQFRVLFRVANANPLDFSVILAVETSADPFRLRRYNGKSHEHTNRIERDRFYDFHIHYATERYQQLGMSPESFAVPTTRYADFAGAFACFVQDCNCVPEDEGGGAFDPQERLF